MAFTRKLLKSMGIEDEKIDQIIDAHTEVTDALKAERDKYKASAEELANAKKELDEIKAKPDDGYKDKYEQEHQAFSEYKAKVAEEKATAEKKSLYRKVLQEAGVDAKRIDSVMRVADLSSVTVKEGEIEEADLSSVTVKEGEIEDRDALIESVKTDWADFIPATSTNPAKPEKPPVNTGGNDQEPHSMAEAMKMRYGVK